MIDESQGDATLMPDLLDGEKDDQLDLEILPCGNLISDRVSKPTNKSNFARIASDLLSSEWIASLYVTGISMNVSIFHTLYLLSI